MVSPPAFPNYLQMRARTPAWAWRTIRQVSVVTAVAVCILLAVWPRVGLLVLWGCVIPLLPLLFVVAPGLWRNACPLAALNQLPRSLGFSRARTLPAWVRQYSYVVGIGLFFLIVPARKALFNGDGPASALLVLAILGAAFTGGVLFKGKSGWCSSICPLLPVQRLYGQTPFLTIRNGHCRPCVGCAKNCYDFNPAVAYVADLYEDDRRHTGHRKLFAAAFPGFIVAFFRVPSPPDVSAIEMYLRVALYVLVTVGAFYILDTAVATTAVKLPALYGAVALNAFYWYSTPILTRSIGELAGVDVSWLTWPIRLTVFGLSVWWVGRTYAKEPRILAHAVDARPVRVGSSSALARHSAAQSGFPEVTFLPDQKRVVVEPGRTLLEVIEDNRLPIEAGCRMGVCGADPIAVLEGMENLSAPGDDERATLQRLGLAANTRMACCARVKGGVSVSLTAERAPAPAADGAVEAGYDPAIERVVIIGNGIAGVTVADHVRRRHPRCEIHVVGREGHLLYNRMAISRLIYGRSAMQGLYLLPDSWYEERQIDCWLNTWATEIDREGRRVLLGTGETLPYDRLILAMGSSSFVPPVPGFGLDGSFVLREAADAMRIRAFAQEHGCRRAVVAGGGLLGLEAGYALRKLGLNVVVLERSPWLLRRQLDRRAGELLRGYLGGLGIDTVLESDTAELEGGVRVERVRLADGQRLPCDLFLVCAGIRPNLALAREAGLAVARGVIVDGAMRTSAPEILAAGDVAEHEGQVYGLWPAAVEQAEVAATNAVGGDARYRGTIPATILKVAGVELLSVGQFDPRSEEETAIVIEDAADHRYRKLVVADGAVVGAILLGYPLLAPVVMAAVKDKVDVRPHLGALRAGDWSALDERVR